MSNNVLYSEAIKAAEEIRVSAENKVRQNLIETLTPQIKTMVEKKLFEEDGSESIDEEELEAYGVESIDEEDTEECGPEAIEENENIDLNSESRRILNKLISKNMQKNAVNEKINSIKESLNALNKVIILSENASNKRSVNKKIVKFYKKIISEFKNLKSNNIVKEDKDLLKNFYILSKEIENMSNRRYNKKFLSESLEDLLEMNLFEEDSDDESSEDVDAEDIFGDEDAEDSEKDDDSSDLMAGLEETDEPQSVTSNTTVEELAQMAGLLEDDAPSEMPAADDDEDEDTSEMELEGIFEDDAPEEGENCGPDEMAESFGRRDRVLEIDENMLRREIGRMKTLREGEAKDMASHFGGGSVEGEVFVDGVELNKLHEMKIKAAKVVRKNRMLESKLSQYKKALRGMKGQLQEMNLFNAKLLYANKLMQNKDLSIKQQRHIVESLDEAKTLGEAKILFESLSKSLVSGRKTSNGKTLSEGAIRRRSSGYSSSPVKSAQTINESVALDRWATLAGIKN
jgi:conjugal transfer/entry exclusion protein